MKPLISNLALLEKNWGPLVRWVTSIVFFLVLYSTIHFADIYYVKRSEYTSYKTENAQVLKEINGKLDTLNLTVAENTGRLQDVQERVHRIENVQDDGRAKETVSEPGDVARK